MHKTYCVWQAITQLLKEKNALLGYSDRPGMLSDIDQHGVLWGVQGPCNRAGRVDQRFCVDGVCCLRIERMLKKEGSDGTACQCANFTAQCTEWRLRNSLRYVLQLCTVWWGRCPCTPESSSAFLYQNTSFFWDRVFSRILDLAISTRGAGQWIPGILLSLHPNPRWALKLQAFTCVPGLYVGPVGLHQGPHDCLAST